MSMSAVVCPNCSMQFTSPGLLYKHQSKFCVGGPTVPNRERDYQHKQNDRSQPHFYTGPQFYNPQGHRSPTESAHTNSSMSIHLSHTPNDREPQRRQMAEQDNRLRELQVNAEHYGRNLEGLQSRQQQLQQQKEEIDRRLSRLGQPDVAYGTEPQLTQAEGRIIHELQRHEDRNRVQLDALRNQLQNLQAGRSNTVGVDLLPEILTMRQSYLRQGGANPGILAQMADLEAEARTAQQSQAKPHKTPTNRGKVEELNEEILTFETENQRLQTELLMMQERNNERVRNVRNKQNAEDMDAHEREARARQKEHMQKLADLEHEMEVAKQEARLERMRRELEEEKQTIPRQIAPPAYQADVPYLLNGQQVDVDRDPLNPAPYDQTSGLVVFYDFAIGLDLSTQFVRLVTCLYNNEAQYGEPTALPDVQAEPTSQTYYSYGSQMALISARQPVPRCPAIKDMSVVIELQTASGIPGHPSQGRLTTKAWAKLDLFDLHGRLISGRWRVPARITPIKPNLTSNDLNRVSQYGAVELFVRLVNQRDADAQSMSRVNPANIHRYTAQPQGINIPAPATPRKHTPRDFMPKTPTTAQPRTAARSPPATKPARKRLEDYDYDQHSFNLGFQIDRVKNAESGEGKVRITAYHKKSGKIVQAATSPVTCSTTSVRSNFKHGYHVYGQQEASFNDVDIKSDIILLVRFYLRKLLTADDNATNGGEIEDTTHDDETLVGWGSMPLMIKRHGGERVNVGTHVLKLYEPPVPDPDSLPADEHYRPKTWKRYKSASARIHVFQGTPRAGYITSSDESDQDDSDIMPEGAWIPHERPKPSKTSFSSTDGIDLYIDGARFLPDSVTVTRVAGRLLDRRYQKAGKDINAMVDADSDIYNPVFNHKVEFREPSMPASATLLLKVYTIDRFFKKLTVVGYATLNVFVAIGTDNQPKLDSGGVQLALNTGCHQLPLYAHGPNGVDPLCLTTLQDAGVRRVPGASLLVRLYQAPIGSSGRPLELDFAPQYDWERLGLWKPMPRYKDRCYYSMRCKPTRGECKMFQADVRRKALSVKDGLRMIQEASDVANLATDKQVAARVKSTMSSTMDADPMDLDLTFIATYDPKFGIKAALDSAMNLPWTNCTHATLCLNPPGAFYMGQPQAAYDKIKFTKELQLNSTTKSPVWKDGFFHFAHRSYHKYLTLVIHLQEISVSVNRETYKYGLLDQAWTAVQVFNEGYVHTYMFQLPLFYGPPKMHLLRSLAKGPPRQWIVDNVLSGALKPVDGASVFVRIADGRRDEELPPEVRSAQLVKLNVDYIPPKQLEKYSKELPGKDLIALVPPGKSPDQFKQDLATKFRSLVHKLYEESVVRKN